MRRLAAWIGLGIVWGACVEGGPDAGSDPGVSDGTAGPATGTGSEGSTSTVTWHEDVRPIFEAHCVSCHDVGGSAPIAFTDRDATWEEPPPWALAAASAVASGSMPPWKADPTCNPIRGARVLSEADKALVAAWSAAGLPSGAGQPYTPPETSHDEGLPTYALRMPEPFVPDTATPDDYRCFVLDFNTASEVWMSGFEVYAQHPEMVHHVILYGLDAGYADDVAAWDAADPAPGYDCLFDPGTWDSAFLAGWAPGQPAEFFGEGIARQLDPGTVLVYQVHYNTQNLGGAPPAADQSGIDLWTLPEGEVPTRELISIPFPVTDLYLPAGAPEVVIEQTVRLGDLLGGVPDALVSLLSSAVRAVGVFPHMHELGTSLEVDVIDGAGTEQCLFRVDDWDFAWQQAYFFEEEAWWVPASDASIRLRCTYDNSAANQPVWNGQQQEPRDVRWGEGTTDEMCLVFFESLIPAGLL
jgi:hypothetical protein